MNRIWTAGVSLALILTASPGSATQRFRAGLDAYDQGRFASAFWYWRERAAKGGVKSESALGMLYYRGLGVKQDDRMAARWFRRAADKGEPTAQFLLGLFFLQGRGVARNYVNAYVWCDLAMSRGYSDALSCRDRAGLHMSDRDFQRADALTAHWLRRWRLKK